MRTVLIDIVGGLSLTGKFPGLQIGVPYYGRVTATGGTPFYSYAIVHGTLPAGLSLDAITGEVTGTPTDTKMAAITVRATDLQGMYVERTFVIPGATLIAESDNVATMLWRYKPIAYADPFPAGIPDEAGLHYDDSSWAQDQGPFGDLSSNPGTGQRAHDHDSRLPSKVNHVIAINTGVWLRRELWLDAVPPNGYDVAAYVDNYLRLYINGAVGFSANNHYDGPADGNIPAAQLRQGSNLIAAWCMDDAAGSSSDSSYFGFALGPAA